MRVFVISLLCACAFVFAASSAVDAKGTVTVQQSDGSTQQYNNVTIVIANKALRVTTADGVGTLVIDKAACSYVGNLQMCLPYSMTLDQGGGTHPLDFQRGTVYVNLTDSKQPLSNSSMQLPPQGILLSLT
ncbi:MAG TPA: hypothetical protein VKF82_05015, partial [Candidatus Eremiobacteraceae bacterium]|nr:hypothetical protein [Candidatus Eremiobacteraceae bacterium]